MIKLVHFYPLAACSPLSLAITTLLLTAPLLALSNSANANTADEAHFNKSRDKSHSLPLEEDDATLTESLVEWTTPEEIKPTHEDWGWVDESHQDSKQQLREWANKMNGWFGKTNPKEPAKASLRVIIDTRWEEDPVDGNDLSVEPRIRGRLKLPVLEDRFSLLIGDDELDDEAVLRQDSSGSSAYRRTPNNDRTIDRKKAREDNASLALRWSRIEEQLGLDADIGVRSGSDVYAKLSVARELYEKEGIKISNDTFYRYGSESEHYARTGMDLRFGKEANRFINNRTTLHYGNENSDERVYWNNDLRQFHYFDNNKQLSYGLSASGDFKGDDRQLNSYGPTVSYRQPIWRKWLYTQTEVNYFNDKAQDKTHYPSVLLRLEALF